MHQQEPLVARFRRSLISLLVLAAVAVASYSAMERGQFIMTPGSSASSISPSKPLIDTLRPERIAMATFAMG
jgi:hypothetical protein